MANEEDKGVTIEAIAEAVAETEKEVFSDALGNEPLEGDGEKSLEAMGDGLEGDDEGEQADAGDDQDDDQGEGEADDKGEGKPARDEKSGQFTKTGVPPGRLKSESDKRRAAESERDDLKTRFEAMQREFDAFKAGQTRQQPQQTQQQQQEQQKPQVPDMFTDPEGFARYVQEQANQTAQNRLVAASFDDAADAHGAEKFGQAHGELMRIATGEAQMFGGKSPTVAKILNAPNPGRALMKWHSERATLAEIGSDPNAWLEKKLEERLNDPEFQAKAIERARGTAKQNGARQTRLPPSLNSQTGASQHEADPDLYDNSEASVFAHAIK